MTISSIVKDFGMAGRNVACYCGFVVVVELVVLPPLEGLVSAWEMKAMDEAKRSVGRTQRDFLAAWWRGDAGPVPCGACSACYYEGIPVDKKRDR